MTDAPELLRLAQDAVAAMKEARDFPTHTCPASRHAAMIAEGLISGGYPMLEEEPEHCAVTIAAVVESLWKARSRIAALEAEIAELEAINTSLQDAHGELQRYLREAETAEAEVARMLTEAKADVWMAAASIARLTMTTNPAADEYTCSLCADEIRRVADLMAKEAADRLEPD